MGSDLHMRDGPLPRAGSLVLLMSGCIIDRDSYAGVRNLTDQRIIATGTVEGGDELIRRRAEPHQLVPLFSGDPECRQVSLDFSIPQEEPFAQFSGTLCNEQNLVVEAGEVTVLDW